MVSLRFLTRWSFGAAVPALLLAGCASTEKMTQSVKQAVHLESTSAPATQVVCFWQRQLTPLPDPTRDGAQTFGLPGQMFLITPDSKPAEANGDLTVVVYDETPRQAGAQAMRPEVWHYTKDTLKRLVTNDERFGKSFALYLPWPAHWRDVTTVKIMGRYQAAGSPDLYAGEVKIALDASGNSQVWTDMGSGSNRPMAGGMLESRTSIPDSNKLLTQANLGGQPAQQFVNPGTMPTGSFAPPPAYSGLSPLPGGTPLPKVTPASNFVASPGNFNGSVVPQPTMPAWPMATSVPMSPTVTPPGPPNLNGPLQAIIIPRPGN